MKKLFLALFAALTMFTSCEQIELDNINDTQTTEQVSTEKTKDLVLNAKFKTSQEQMITRAVATGKTVYMKAYDVLGGAVVDSVDCGSFTFPNFPSVSFKSKYGQHRYVFILSESDMNMKDGLVSFTKQKDALIGTLDLNVTAKTAKTHNVNLSRMASQIKFTIEDGEDLASDLKTVVVKLKDKKGRVNVLGESVTIDNNGDHTSNVTGDFETSLKAGPTSISNFILTLDDEEKSVDLTISFLDKDGNTILSYDMNNVPYKRNYITTISGKFLGDNSGFTFDYNIEWNQNSEYNFGVEDF